MAGNKSTRPDAVSSRKTVKQAASRSAPLRQARLISAAGVARDEYRTFMDLPPELRQMERDREGNAKLAISSRKAERRRFADELMPLYRLRNASIAREASEALFSINTFNFEGTKTMESFLERIGTKAKYLRHISLATFEPNGKAFNYFRSSIHLQSITVPHEKICQKDRVFVESVQWALWKIYQGRQKTATMTKQNVADIINIETKPVEECESCADPSGYWACLNGEPGYRVRCNAECSELSEHYKEIEDYVKDQVARSVEDFEEAEAAIKQRRKRRRTLLYVDLSRSREEFDA